MIHTISMRHARRVTVPEKDDDGLEMGNPGMIERNSDSDSVCDYEAEEPAAPAGKTFIYTHAIVTNVAAMNQEETNTHC